MLPYHVLLLKALSQQKHGALDTMQSQINQAKIGSSTSSMSTLIYIQSRNN